MYNEEVQSEYTLVEQKQDKKHENDPKETTLSMNKTALYALTLAGPTVTRPVPDPLAVLSLDN